MYASFLLSSLRVLVPLLYSYFRYYNKYYVYKYYCTSCRITTTLFSVNHKLVLRYKNHSERGFFAVTSLGGKHNVIMGHTWLHKHNQDIDWITGDVKMTRCPDRCCSGCLDEIQEKSRARKLEARRISTCSKGECPALLPDDHDEDEPDSEFEEGDRIFVTTPEQPTEYIQAGSTISQRLA